MAKIVGLGELLIDFIQSGISENGNPFYEANPGGAPCNFLAMAQKLGNSSLFIGKVGNDNFGNQLEETLINAGIDTSGLVKSEVEPTTLAFVHHDSTGDRSFTFYRKNGADAALCEDDVRKSLFAGASLFHFGTLSMTNEICRAATLKAIKIAQDNKILISFDPNLRETLWDNLDRAKLAFIEGFKVCNILKIADNELQWFTGIDNLDEAIISFRAQYPIDLIFLTLGKNGSKAYYKESYAFAPTFLDLKCVDTTGAGDSFMGSAISKILSYGLDNLNSVNLKETLTFANAAASLVASRKGVIKSLPTLEEIEKLEKTI
jgi:fructokinase